MLNLNLNRKYFDDNHAHIKHYIYQVLKKMCYRNIIFFLKEFYLFIWEPKKQRKLDRDRAPIHQLTFQKLATAKSKPGAENAMQDSHLGGRNSVTWAILAASQDLH